MKKKIKLSEWAKINCMEYRSAWRLAKSGKLDDIVEILPSGKILILVDETEKNEKDVYLYARVSSHDQKEDLERQLKTLFLLLLHFVLKYMVQESQKEKYWKLRNN